MCYEPEVQFIVFIILVDFSLQSFLLGLTVQETNSVHIKYVHMIQTTFFSHWKFIQD